MAYDRYEERRGLSFEQAEGIAPLPTQLKRNQVSDILRGRVWQLFDKIIQSNCAYRDADLRMIDPWDSIASDEYLHRHKGFIDRNSDTQHFTEVRFRDIAQNGDYINFYGLIQFILQHSKCPKSFSSNIDKLLVEERSAYRVIGGDTLVPIASDEIANAIKNSLAASHDAGLKGPHSHIRRASIELSNGNFSDSVRESISAVESIARVLEPTADLSKALARLERAGHLHKALKHGFANLYGWTSDENGIRHALQDDGDAKVDEADAIFMIGACASFVTYMISKKQAAGIMDC